MDRRKQDANLTSVTCEMDKSRWIKILKGVIFSLYRRIGSPGLHSREPILLNIGSVSDSLAMEILSDPSDNMFPEV